MNQLLARIVRYFMTKHNLAWVGTCEHKRSPDVIVRPLPACPECTHE